MSYVHLAVRSCPHIGHCSQALGCHQGSVPTDRALLVDTRDSWWFARSWTDEGRTVHTTDTEGDEPRLEEAPSWGIGRW